MRLLRSVHPSWFFDRYVLVWFFLAAILLATCGCPKQTGSASKTRTPSPPPPSEGSSPDIEAQQLRLQKALSSLGDHCYPGRQLGPLPSEPPNQEAQSTHDDFEDPAVAHPPTASGYAALRTASYPAPQGSSQNKRTISDLQQLALLNDIERARYRAEKGELMLIGPEAPQGQGLSYDDWLAAFRAISGPEEPGVTIDPGPSPNLMQVKYFGSVEDTHFGDTMFEADRTLKMLSTGFDNNNCASWAGGPREIETELDLLTPEMADDSLQPGWHRFWFAPSDDHLSSSADGMTVHFPTHRWVVKDESIPPGKPSRASARQFAQSVSSNFMTLTNVIPAFAELQRQAAIVALAKWMVDKHVPVDKSWIQTAPANTHGPNTTPAVTVVRATLQDQTYLRFGIYGGVDFQKDNTYVQSPDLLAPFQAALKKRPTGAAAWGFQFEGRKYQAIILKYRNPYVLRPGRTAWTSYVRTWWQPATYRWNLPTTNLVVHNKSGVPIAMELRGPVTKHLTVAAGGSATMIRIVPGSYKITTSSTCGNTNRSLNLDLDKESSLTYTCENSSAPAIGAIEVDNETQAEITIQASGPSSGTYTAPPGTSTFRVAAGYYTITAISRCGRRSESTNLTAGGTYKTRYWCETQQGGGSATLVINNNTGGSMTIQLSGASQRTYTAAAGTSTIPLTAGFNTITASCRCGTRSNQVNVSAGSTYTETYSCVTQ